MDIGIIFNGIDAESLGLEYVPDDDDIFPFKTMNADISEQSFSGHDGGYYFGVTIPTKKLTLKFMYEEKTVNDGFVSKIQSIFGEGKHGKLVYKIRPWCYYNAVVTNFDVSSIYAMKHGFINISMNVYRPYSYCEFNYLDSTYEYKDDVLNTSAYMVGSEWTIDADYAQTAITDSTNIYIPNFGTKKAFCEIQIAGNVGSGVYIENKTTGQKVKVVGLTKALTTNVSKWLSINSENGMCYLTNGSTNSNGFLYHGSGFLNLDTSFPIIRGQTASSDGSSTIEFDDDITDDIVGKFICADDNSFKYKVTAKSTTKRYTVTPTISTAFTDTAVSIITMNNIYVYGVDSFELTRLKILYKPLFR